jgi:hypothetical protein
LTNAVTQDNNETIKEWSKHLEHLNYEATKYTLKATTQLIPSVEAETRLAPRMHLKCRLPSLQPKRLNEGFGTDTFFSEVKSSCGNKCGQVFLGIKSGYTVFIPLQSKAYAYVALSDYIIDDGAPLFLSAGTAKEENLGKWISICRTIAIQKQFSKPFYQHQNKVEHRIQDIKRRASLVMKQYNAPERFWDYACEYITELINHSATWQLAWRTPYESLHGKTPDILLFLL